MIMIIIMVMMIKLMLMMIIKTTSDNNENRYRKKIKNVKIWAATLTASPECYQNLIDMTIIMIKTQCNVTF